MVLIQIMAFLMIQSVERSQVCVRKPKLKPVGDSLAKAVVGAWAAHSGLPTTPCPLLACLTNSGHGALLHQETEG